MDQEYRLYLIKDYEDWKLCISSLAIPYQTMINLSKEKYKRDDQPHRRLFALIEYFILIFILIYTKKRRIRARKKRINVKHSLENTIDRSIL